MLLLKTEPDEYSFDDLARDGRTRWDGVTNPLAQKHMRAARKGERAVIYHTGGERRAVGLAELVTDPYPDPADPAGKRVVFDLAPLGPLPRAVGLDELKDTAVFARSPLVKMGRLSVVPLDAAQWKALERLARAGRARRPASRRPASPHAT